MKRLPQLVLFVAAVATPALAGPPWEHWNKFAACGGASPGPNSSDEGFMTTRSFRTAGTKNDRDHRSARSLVYRPLNVNANGKTLLVFLHGGDGGSADHYTKFYEWAVTRATTSSGSTGSTTPVPRTCAPATAAPPTTATRSGGSSSPPPRPSTTASSTFSSVRGGPGRGTEGTTRSSGGSASSCARWPTLPLGGRCPVRRPVEQLPRGRQRSHSPGLVEDHHRRPFGRLASGDVHPAEPPVVKGLFFSGPKTRLSRR